MTAITAERVRELPGREEDSVTGPSQYASEPARNSGQWWAGVPGLDPWFAMQDTATAAHLAAMACAAHVLGDLFAESTWSTRDVAGYVRDWHKWLTGTHDTVMAYLRRYAMRLASSVGLAPQDVLLFAKAIYEGCGGR